jgi:hypothetical protein
VWPHIELGKECNMDFDAWNHWLLLRPLIVFLLAAPMFFAAVLVGWRQGRRQAMKGQRSSANQAGSVSSACDDRTRDGGRAHAEPEAKTPAATKTLGIADQELAAEIARAAFTVPREWDGGPLRPNLCRQTRLGNGR